MDHTSSTTTLRSRSPLRFFVLIFTLSVPFWLIGAVTGLQLVGGLPVSSLMAFCPLIAASILVYGENGRVAVTELLERSLDYERTRVKVWYVPIVLLSPSLLGVTYGLMRVTEVPLAGPRLPVPVIVIMFLVFLLAGLGEEVGWSGYATDPLQDRWNALLASIILGLVWATWHFTPLLQADRSPIWIAWWCLSTVAARTLIVWLYNNTRKSVFAAALFHAVLNASFLLFPSYDIRIYSSTTAFVALLVTVFWGPRTLARNKLSH